MQRPWGSQDIYPPSHQQSAPEDIINSLQHPIIPLKVEADVELLRDQGLASSAPLLNSFIQAESNYKEYKDEDLKYEACPFSRQCLPTNQQQTSQEQQHTYQQYERAFPAAMPPYVPRVYPHMSAADFSKFQPLNGGGQFNQYSTVQDNVGNGLLPINVIRKQRLNLKRLSNDEPRPFKCHTCGTDFKQKVALSQHERIHSDSRPYGCSECGKRFRQKSHLTQHLRIHANEKPYMCVYCERTFRQRAILNQHLRIHSGEKPYECSECGKNFRQKAILNQHVRTHRTEQCSPIVSATLAALEAHRKKI